MSEQSMRIKNFVFRADSGRSTFKFDVQIREGGNGRTFDVIIIKAGRSANAINGKRIFYSEEVLQAAVGIFEGTPVNAHRIGQERVVTSYKLITRNTVRVAGRDGAWPPSVSRRTRGPCRGGCPAPRRSSSQ